MGKSGLIGSFVVLGIIGFGVWGVFFYPDAGDSHTLQSPTASSSDFDLEEIAAEMHRQVNSERVIAGLSPLAYDQTLASISAAHSINMQRNGFFDHVDNSGLDHTARANQAGHNCPVGENISNFPSVSGYSSMSLGRAVVQDWMNSPEHRANILDARFNSEGFGVSIVNGDAYFTQMLSFC